MNNLAIGIDIGGTNIKAGLVDSSGNVFKFSKIPTNAKDGFNRTFKSIQSLVEKYIDIAGRNNLIGIGCACTGQIDSVNGKVLYAANTFPELLGFQLKKEFQVFSGLRVEVENDVNAAALGEKWIGAAKDIDNFLTIALGTGVGGAIYKNGDIDHGFRGVSGEFGHMSINFNGEQCSCGNKGCFERYAAVSSLIRHFKDELAKGEKSMVVDMVHNNLDNINGEIIFKAEALGDRLATKIVNEYNEAIATGIVSLIHIFNPEAVIVGGGITALGNKFISPIRKDILLRLMPVFSENLIIRGAELGDLAAICGISRKLFH